MFYIIPSLHHYLSLLYWNSLTQRLYNYTTILLYFLLLHPFLLFAARNLWYPDTLQYRRCIVLHCIQYFTLLYFLRKILSLPYPWHALTVFMPYVGIIARSCVCTQEIARILLALSFFYFFIFYSERSYSFCNISCIAWGKIWGKNGVDRTFPFMYECLLNVIFHWGMEMEIHFPRF